MQNTPNDDIDTFFSGIYDLSNRIKNIIHNIKLYAFPDCFEFYTPAATRNMFCA